MATLRLPRLPRRLNPRMTVVEEGAGVTPMELFFDLVFVYAITQVVTVMADGENAQSLARGLLILAVLWWCWSCFAWLGNTVRADEGLARLALFGVMAVMFVVAVTIPEAFEDLPGGLTGPLVFAGCYLAVRVLHLVLYRMAAGDDAGLRRTVLLAWIPLSGGTLILIAAAFVDGWTQVGLWALALAWDYGLILAIGPAGWRIRSAAHWAERHGLVIIMALGESIVSIGVGVADLAISVPIIIAAVLGIVVAAALWWAYFDMIALAAEHVLSRARGDHRVSLAVHGYTYLHLPLMAGIVLVAMGLKKVLTYVGDTEHHTLSEPLHGVGLYALYGGVILYLLGHGGFGLRVLGKVKVQRLVTACLLVALVPVAALVPALVALAMLAAVLAVLIGWETVRYAEAREEIRRAPEAAGQEVPNAQEPAG